MEKSENLTSVKWSDTLFYIGDKVEWRRQHRHPSRYVEVINGIIIAFPHYNLVKIRVPKMRDRLVPIRLLKKVS